MYIWQNGAQRRSKKTKRLHRIDKDRLNPRGRFVLSRFDSWFRFLFFHCAHVFLFPVRSPLVDLRARRAFRSTLVWEGGCEEEHTISLSSETEGGPMREQPSLLSLSLSPEERRGRGRGRGREKKKDGTVVDGKKQEEGGISSQLATLANRS
jgi:hypothetical protein